MNVEEVIRINDSWRRDDADGDLFPVAEANWKQFQPNSSVPTCIPPGRFALDEVFNPVKRFNKVFPWAAGLLPIPSVVCCGGCALATVGKGLNPPSDIDLFIYGVDPTSQEDLWAVVSTILDKILSLNLTVTSFSIAEGVIKINVTQGEIQVILRAYKTVSSIVHGFDLAPACVAFDGTQSFVTTFGIYGITTGIPVVLKYSSPSYKYRLEKYFTRGFPVELLDFKPPSWDQKYMLKSGTKVGPTSFRAIGSCAEYELSDYAMVLKSRGVVATTAAWFTTGQGRPVYLGSSSDELKKILGLIRSNRSLEYSDLVSEEQHEDLLDRSLSELTGGTGLPRWLYIINRKCCQDPEIRAIYASWFLTPPASRDLPFIQEKIYDMVLKYLEWYSKLEHPLPIVLSSFLGKQDPWDAVVAWSKEEPKKFRVNRWLRGVVTPEEISGCKFQVPGYGEFISRVKQTANEIRKKSFDPALWWVVQDPSRQYTSSRHSTPSTVESWY